MGITKKSQAGSTLIELIFVVAILAVGSILAFESQTADLQSNAAKDAGVHLRTYGKAVQKWVNDHPGTSGTFNGTKWLKPFKCGGLAPAPGYLDCSFFAADATDVANPDPIRPGGLTLSTIVSTSASATQKETRAVTTTSPYYANNQERADLAGIAAISAAVGNSYDRSSFGTVTSNPQQARIILTTLRTDNSDIWLKLDGSNALNANLSFDGVNPLSRRILGASSIQSAPGQPLILGSETGIPFAISPSLVVDSDTEILGRLLADGGIDSSASIVIQSGSVSIPQGDLLTKQGFSTSASSPYVANPAGVSKLKNLTTEGLVRLNGDTDIPAASRPDSFLQIKATYVELSGCFEDGQAGTDNEGNLMSCQFGIWRKVGQNPLLHRFVFTSNTTWQVPSNVTGAFVTLAGGGGSGYGWRVESHTRAGSSGGFLFNEKITVTPGETLQIIVGKGGKGYAPVNTGAVSNAGYPYYIYAGNPSDPGLVGWNGTSSKILSGTGANLVECSGGGGAGETYADPNGRPAGGPSSVNIVSFAPAAYTLVHNYGNHSIWGNVWHGGICGPNNYGLGIEGTYSWTNIGTILFGGRTPFSYGSGGDVTVTRCYVSKTVEVPCKFPQDGKDGVVMIDVFY